MTNPATSTVTSRPACRPDAAPTCQHCLADTSHTPIAFHLPQNKRCPVCGAAYTGPRRTAAFQLLLTAGLVQRGDY